MQPNKNVYQQSSSGTSFVHLIQTAWDLQQAVERAVEALRLSYNPFLEPSKEDEDRDKKIEDRAVSTVLSNNHLPERIRQQLNSLEPIESFEVLESLFQDLEKERQGIAGLPVNDKLKEHRLNALHRIAEGFIHNFKGELDFVQCPDFLEQIEALFKFFPANMRVQFEGVAVISLNTNQINKAAQWFLGDKTAVHLVDAAIEDLPAAMYGLSEFTTIDIHACPHLKSIENIGLCENLKVLEARTLRCLQTLAGIEECKQLQKINLRGCKKLQDISALNSCPDLEEIKLHGYKALRGIHTLAGCRKLNKIHLKGCKRFKFLSELGEYQALEEIHCEGCVNLKNLSGLVGCQKLKKIYLSECKNLQDINVLDKLLSLEEIRLVQCFNLKNFSGLEGCQELKTIGLRGCKNFKDLSILANCQKLKKIELRQCKNLEDISILDKLLDLEEVILSECENLKNLSVLANCQKLKKIGLHISQHCLFRNLPEALQKVVSFSSA